jgi:hypothetical protein
MIQNEEVNNDGHFNDFVELEKRRLGGDNMKESNFRKAKWIYLD